MEKRGQAVSGEVELGRKEDVAQVQELPEEHGGRHRHPWQLRGDNDLGSLVDV